MDAFSYRVWDRRARRMLTCPDDGIFISQLPGQQHHIVYWFNPRLADWELITDAQVDFATPFRDCHGTVIFENDIIRTHHGDGVVYMSRDTGQWMAQLDLEIPELFAQPREFIEIVGTVYRNSDLLGRDPGRDRTDEEM